MKIEMCSDRALTKPAVIVHGRTGWCLTKDAGEAKHSVKQFIFYMPNGKSGLWMRLEEYQSLVKSIKDKNRDYYAAHKDELTEKILGKQSEAKILRRHSRCGRWSDLW